MNLVIQVPKHPVSQSGFPPPWRMLTITLALINIYNISQAGLITMRLINHNKYAIQALHALINISDISPLTLQILNAIYELFKHIYTIIDCG